VQDIAPLVRAMVARFNAKFHKNLFGVSPPALAALEAFPWPGNLRQLENFVQQAVLVGRGPELLPEHLPQPVRDYRPVLSIAAVPASPGSLSRRRDEVERDAIQRVLANGGYTQAQAAAALGISRVTLYSKIKKYGLTWRPSQAAATTLHQGEPLPIHSTGASLCAASR
jgi:DNA-binding NtrC family response regulator